MNRKKIHRKSTIIISQLQQCILFHSVFNCFHLFYSFRSIFILCQSVTPFHMLMPMRSLSEVYNAFDRHANEEINEVTSGLLRERTIWMFVLSPYKYDLRHLYYYNRIWNLCQIQTKRLNLFKESFFVTSRWTTINSSILFSIRGGSWSTVQTKHKIEKKKCNMFNVRCLHGLVTKEKSQ